MSYTVIPLKELRQDAILPAAIFDGDNNSQMLLNRGISLTRENLRALQRRGISHVAIDSRYVKEVWSSPQTGRTGIRLQQQYLADQRRKEELRAKSLDNRLVRHTVPQYNEKLENQLATRQTEHAQQLQAFLKSMQESKVVRSDVVKNLALESIEDLLQDIDLFVKTTLEYTQKDCHQQHCLRVAKLAMSIATIMEFREEDVKHIGIGCLLSRVGIDESLRELLENPRLLTPLEVLEVKKHPSRTWNVLEKIADLPVGARQVAWQINERWNGSGYPRGRSQKQIHPLARIAGVADCYIALTSDRPHRSALTPHEAVRVILAETQQGLFEPEAVRGLLRTVSLFPLGSVVELSTGLLAITIRSHPDRFGYPVVKTVCDLQGSPVPPQYLDLSQENGVYILQTYTSQFLEERLNQWANSSNPAIQAPRQPHQAPLLQETAR